MKNQPAGTLIKSESGFLLIEAMIVIAFTGSIIFLSLFLASESSRQTQKQGQYDQSYIMLQNLVETLFVSTGKSHSLEEGKWGPKCYDENGLETLNQDCPIKVFWNITPDAVMGMFMRIDVIAEYKINDQDRTSKFTFYRSKPVSSFSEASKIVKFDPPANLDYKWFQVLMPCIQQPLADPPTIPIAAPGTPGIRNVHLYCRASNTSPAMDASFCKDPAPPATIACIYAGPSYYWFPKGWTTCTSGSQTRIVECKADNYLLSADSECISRGKPKPATSQACEWKN